MPRAIASVFLLLLLSSPGQATADQDDPRLDDLFAELQEARSPATVERLSRRIWALWGDHGDERVMAGMQAAREAMAAGRLAQAESVLDRVVARAPDFAEGWNLRATVRYLRGRFPESAADVRRVLALEPRHFGALEGLGLIYLELGLDDAALGAFERALAVNPHLPGARQRSRSLRRDAVTGDS